LRASDQAMYAAKAVGKDRVMVADLEAAAPK
jgi:GGDEF domain-containing protein